MTGPVVGVLALQGDVREHVRALEAVGARVRLVRRESELAEVGGLVVPGGESTTIDRLLRAFDLFEPLRERIVAGLPVLGSCAGLILLADRLVDRAAGQQTLGGIDMLVERNAFGRQVDSFETDLDFRGVTGGPLRAVFIRAPRVVEVGPDVEVLATVPGPSEEGEHGATIVAVRHGPLVATAFHPEISGDLRVHRLFVGIVAGGDRAVVPLPAAPMFVGPGAGGSAKVRRP